MTYIIYSENQEDLNSLEFFLLNSKIINFQMTASFSNFLLYLKNYRSKAHKAILYGNFNNIVDIVNLLEENDLNELLFCNNDQTITSNRLEIKKTFSNSFFSQLNKQAGLTNLYVSDFLIRMGNKLIKVQTTDIIFIESQGNYIHIQTKNSKFVVRESLKEISLKLSVNFIRVHSSFIINTQYLENIIPSENKLQIADYQIPISRKYKKNLLVHFTIC